MSLHVRVRGRRDCLSQAIFAGVVALLSARSALACSVCFGDANSALSRGAQAGMLVLLGVVGVVLVGVVSLILFWMRRAANLRGLQGLQALPTQATALEDQR